MSAGRKGPPGIRSENLSEVLQEIPPKISQGIQSGTPICILPGNTPSIIPESVTFFQEF